MAPGASNATTSAEGCCSRMRYTSMEVNPCTAFVTTPAEVAKVSGSAK